MNITRQHTSECRPMRPVGEVALVAWVGTASNLLDACTVGGHHLAGRIADWPVQTLLTMLTQTRKPVVDGIIVHALRAYP